MRLTSKSDSAKVPVGVVSNHLQALPAVDAKWAQA
jgi:hypothetical protein